MKKDMEKDIILFGAGKHLEDMLPFIEMEKVRYICDNDDSRHGKELYGKKIIGIKELKELSSCCKIKIVITSNIYMNDIIKQLEKEGLDQYVDHFYFIRDYILFQEGEKAYFGLRYDDVESKIYKREFFKGSIANECSLVAEEDMVLPVGMFTFPRNIGINYNGEVYNKCFEHIGYYYLRVNEGERLNLEADAKVIIGDPIAIGPKSHRGKIKLLIIVDDLPQMLLEGEQLGLLMPNTKRYFKDGVIFTNGYSTTDWTLPGVATIHTGAYPKEHRMLHPKNKTVLSKKNIAGEFKERGYLTSHMGSSYRGRPDYGYIKNVDRFIYGFSYEKGVAYEMIANTMEHIRAFPNRDHFIVLDFFDMHHDHRGNADISLQMEESLAELFHVNPHKGKSVAAGFDAVGARIHQKRMSRLDYYLQTLYSFLDNYGKENVSVVMAADHGVPYLVPRPDDPVGWEGYNTQMNPCMIKVPLLVQDPGLTFQIVSHNIDNTVVYPILKRMADGNVGNDELLQLSQKEFVYNESIYPGQNYCLKILQGDVIIDYISKDVVGEDCKIPLEFGTFRVWDEKSGKEIQDVEILDKYESVIRQHIGGQ